MKVVINRCYGGFGLSKEAWDVYAEAKGLETGEWSGWGFYEKLSSHDIERHDPVLVQVVEQLGKKKASGNCAELDIIEIPDGLSYVVEEYDGKEWIAETHRTWR